MRIETENPVTRASTNLPLREVSWERRREGEGGRGGKARREGGGEGRGGEARRGGKGGRGWEEGGGDCGAEERGEDQH